MKFKLNYLLLVCCCLFMVCSCQPEITTGSISGFVHDADNGEPIKSVNIELDPVGLSAVTGSDGRYEFNDVEEGLYTIIGMKGGYESNTKTIQIKAGQVSSGDMVLKTGSSKIKSSHELLNFGTTETILTFNLSNIGTAGVVEWKANVSENWLKLSSVGGKLPFGEKTTVSVTVDREKIANTVSASITITDVTFNTDLIIAVTASASGSSGGGGGGGGGDTGGIVAAAALMAYYTFDSGTAADKTENKCDGVIHNDAELITDTPNGVGKSLFMLSLKDQYLSLPHNFMRGKTSWSVAFWIKDFGPGQIMTIQSGEKKFRCINIDADNFVYVDSYHNTRFSYNTTSIQASGWHHMAITLNSGSAKLYIDGSLVDSISIDDRDGNEDSIQFGPGPYLSSGYKTNMKLDNIRFYTREVPKDDIALIYNSEK